MFHSVPGVPRVKMERFAGWIYDSQLQIIIEIKKNRRTPPPGGVTQGNSIN